MLLWEIAEEKLPFHNERDILKIRNLVVKEKVRPTFSSTVPSEWVKISHQGIKNFIYLSNLFFLHANCF